MNNNLKKGLSACLKTSCTIGFSWYLVPHFISDKYSKWKKPGDEHNNYLDSEMMGRIGGRFLGLTFLTAQILGYGLAIDSGVPDVLGFPLGSNITSFSLVLLDKYLSTSENLNSSATLEEKLSD